MIQTNAVADPKSTGLPSSLPKGAENIIQSCLREDEWSLADEEFYRIARETLESMAKGRK